MGLAGSGKSTQGQKLAEATGRTWLSAGQVLRDTNDPEIRAILNFRIVFFTSVKNAIEILTGTV